MKTLRNLLAGAAVLVLAASCLNSEDPYEAGFVFRKPGVESILVFMGDVQPGIFFFDSCSPEIGCLVPDVFTRVCSGSGKQCFYLFLYRPVDMAIGQCIFCNPIAFSG